MNTWGSFDSGGTLGGIGSESGVILLDDEHPDGARITIERDCHASPFAITCGIYGWMLHTRFFSTEAEARQQCGEMKQALVELMSVLNEIGTEGSGAGDACSRFVARFP
jgi:hypothetical protein